MVTGIGVMCVALLLGFAAVVHTEGSLQWYELNHIPNQNLDHFNPFDNRVFKQRYWTSRQFWKGDGPVFLYVGGEELDTDFLHYGERTEKFARTFRALCFHLEHRYYGLSSPYPANVVLTTESLRYVSADQALADIADFIQRMNALYSLHNKKWVLFGGGYAGSLAAWAKLRYPGLVFAAVSASAPLKADFSQRLPEEECERIRDLGGISHRPPSIGGRIWLYQVCSEFGWINKGDCNGTQQNDANNLVRLCTQNFGWTFNLPRALSLIKWTNQKFGGKEFNAEHVMFIHGSLDSWSHFGITNSSNPLMPAWVIPGAGHCAVLHSDDVVRGRGWDIKEVNQAQERVIKYLTEWLERAGQ